MSPRYERDSSSNLETILHHCRAVGFESLRNPNIDRADRGIPPGSRVYSGPGGGAAKPTVEPIINQYPRTRFYL